jgi:disulfide oxidoreductase YuzD
MSEVEKNTADLTATSDATTDEITGQSQLSEESQTQIDYKAKLEEEVRRREKAEAKIIEQKRVMKESQVEEPVSQDLEKLLEDKLEQKFRELQFQTQEHRYSDVIKSYSTSAEEAQLMEHILKHDIVASGDIEKDVRRAKMLANEDKITQENTELKRALTARNTAGGISSGGQKVRETKQQWSAKDIKFAKEAGIDLSKLK